MRPDCQERRREHFPEEEFRGLAARSLREGVPVDELDLRLQNPDGSEGLDAKRVDELRAGAKKELLAMAGYSTEKAAAELSPVVAEANGERSPEQIWLGNFRTRFDALAQLHEGIKWADVERSLKADPETRRKLQALDEKGHKMNVFGEDGDEYIFASAWDNYNEVSQDHRNIVFDAEAQEWLKTNHPGEKCNGNAVDIAKTLGVDLAETKLHEQLRQAIAVDGWAWLKTDAATRATGDAFCGDGRGILGNRAGNHDGCGSLRAALRVKKA